MEIAVALPLVSLVRLCGVTAGALVVTTMSVGYLYDMAQAHVVAPTIKSARVLSSSPTPLPQLEAKAFDVAVRVPVAVDMVAAAPAAPPPAEELSTATAAPQAAQPSEPIEVVALQQGRWVEAGQGVQVWENAPAEGWTLVGSAE